MLPVLAMAAAVVPAGTTFNCTPTAVYDGDGPIWCAEGPHVRLSGIAAREMDGTCRPNQPCPDATAIAARDALVQLLGGARGRLPTGHVLVRGPTMNCVSRGSAGGTRTAALCTTSGIGDLSCAMVRSGKALRWTRYGGDRLCR
jgi:endonuclease YncB( thermonuclease family)